MQQEQPNNFYGINELGCTTIGTRVKIRARVHTLRAQAKIIFVILRQQTHTLQCIYLKKSKTGDSKNVLSHRDNVFFDQMADLIASVTKESIVDVVGVTKKATHMVKSCSIQDIEIEIESVKVVSGSDPKLPIQIDEHIYLPKVSPSDESTDEKEERESKLVTRLNNRVLDLRRQDNIFIFRMQAFISKTIRKFLEKNKFMEIHSPKLIPAASEGGSNVFEVKYFNQNAYLAQSPQLYKQMAICADFSRVYEIGPVFRAEKSFTHRHLTEFTGIDMEMTFNEHYHEVLNLFDRLFTTLFSELNTVHQRELSEFWKKFGIEPFEYTPSVRITFKDAVALLRENGIEMSDYEDFNTEKEKTLGKIIKNKYHTDFFMVDQFPSEVRPFYTMPSSENPLYSNSYDFFMRGEEILSGAQRINNYKMLINSANSHGIDTTKIADYLESFRYGVPPHAGGGIGLERVVMLYLGVNNIRNVSLFPRDPSRIAP